MTYRPFPHAPRSLLTTACYSHYGYSIAMVAIVSTTETGPA